MGAAVIGAGGWLAAAADVAMVASAGASIYMMSQQGGTSQAEPPQINPQTQAATIDKTQAQTQADKGKLQLGEGDLKKKRKKGKAAFEIALNKQDSANTASDTSGVQTKKPAQLGVQL
jgi:hypothetical protein